MNSRRLGLVAATATLLAAVPLCSIFERWTWLIQCFLAVAAITLAATLARGLRWPVWAQPGPSVVALLFALTWMFPSHRELVGIIPSVGTFKHFGQLLRQSVTDVRELGVPVPDGDPLLFLAVLGVGSVAVCVDLFVVGLRRPALAGLPMLAIYSVPVAVCFDSVPMLPFMVGACAFMWLLASDNVERVRRFGRRFSGDGRNVDGWEPFSLAAAGRRLAVISVVLAVALPVGIPGMTAGLIDRFGTNGGGRGGGGSGYGRGTGTSVDLFADLSGQLRQDDVTELARVRTSEPNPFYLRFGVADQLTHNGFAARTPSGRPSNRSLPSEVTKSAGVSQHRYRATVEITGLDMGLLPVFTQPVSLRGVDDSWYYDERMNVIFSFRASTKDKKYTFDYVRSRYSPQALTAAEPLDPDDTIQRRYTEVVPIPQIQQKVAELTAGKRTGYDKVLAIFNFFSHANGFSYRLETESGTSGSAIVDFLDSKAGFCEQYAAAMAWLVRTAGIPARVAFGFTRGSHSDGDFQILTNRNLHAWTEVYFKDIGWVPFDATPAASVPGATDTAWARNPDAPTRSTDGASPSAGETDPAAGATGTADPEVRDPFADGSASAPSIEPNASNWVWWSLALAVLTLMLLGAPAGRRNLLRYRRRMVRTPRRAAGVLPDPATVDPGPGGRPILVAKDAAATARAYAHAAWDELLDTMVDFRLTVDQTETPRTTAERLIRVGRLDARAADGVRLLARAEERASYARDPLISDQLVRSLRAVRRAFARQASRRTRIMAVVLPPSVLRRGRQAVVEGATLTAAMLARWQDLSRLVPGVRRRVSGRSSLALSLRRLLPRRG